MNQKLKKALFVCCLFILVFSYFFSGIFPSGGYYDRHFFKAKNGCIGSEIVYWDKEPCESYAPLFHWLARPFTFHENAFFYFVIILIGLITPLLLFALTKNWLSVILYFTTTTYFYFMIDGFFSQAIAGILLLTIFLTKDWRIQTIILLLSIFSHGHGFLLCLTAFLITNFKNGFFSCSATFGANKPQIFESPIEGMVTTGTQFTVSHALVFFARIFPLPSLVFSVWYAVTKKYRLDLLVMSIVCFAGGFLISHRTFYFIPLLLIPSLTMFASEQKGNWKTGFWLLVFVSFLYLFGGWINFKTCLGFL